MNTETNQLLLIALAGLMGGVIGLEREIAGKAAGLRTHVFVSMSSCLLMILGDDLIARMPEFASSDLLRSDPTRIIQAIIVGVSFLGAGTIVHSPGDQVEGLTTAASILLTCCLGIAVALRLFVISAGVCGLAVVVLVGVGFVERHVSGRR